MQNDRNRTTIKKVDVVPSFGLVSEHGNSHIMVKPGPEADCINLPQTRSLSKVYYISTSRTDYFENISLMALEGSHLTLMGLLAYNSETGKLELTKVSSIIAGGAKELIRYLNEEIRSMK